MPDNSQDLIDQCTAVDEERQRMDNRRDVMAYTPAAPWFWDAVLPDIDAAIREARSKADDCGEVESQTEPTDSLNLFSADWKTWGDDMHSAAGAIAERALLATASWDDPMDVYGIEVRAQYAAVTELRTIGYLMQDALDAHMEAVWDFYGAQIDVLVELFGLIGSVISLVNEAMIWAAATAATAGGAGIPAVIVVAGEASSVLSSILGFTWSIVEYTKAANDVGPKVANDYQEVIDTLNESSAYHPGATWPGGFEIA